MLIFSADEAWQRQLLRFLIKGRLAGIISFFSIFILGMGWFYTVQPKYTVIMLVTEAENPIEKTVPTLPNLGGIFDKSSQENLKKLKVIISSESFSRLLEKKHDISKKIFNNRWDANQNKWFETPFYIEALKRVKSIILRKDYSLHPDIEDVYHFIATKLQIVGRPNDPAWEMRLTHEDPDTAMLLLTIIHKEAEQLLRDNVLDQARRNLDFLNRRAQNTSNNSLMNAISDLMGRELRREMLAGNDGPFAAEILIRPSIASAATSPNFGSVLPFILFLSTFMGSAAALGYGLLRARAVS